MNTFNSDLHNGKIYEHKVCKDLRTKHPSAYIIPGEYKPADIYIPDIDLFIEVKHDDKVKKTGNFFIETEYQHEPSGIRASEAAWWAVCDDYYAYFIPLKDLESIVYDLEEWAGTIDNRFVKGYKVRKQLITKHPNVRVRELPY